LDEIASSRSINFQLTPTTTGFSPGFDDPFEMSSTKIALIIGAGPNIGSALTKTFASKGYKVALAARRRPDGINSEGHLEVKVDLSTPDDVGVVFEKVQKAFGGPPSVVCYNAARLDINQGDPIATFDADILTQSLVINTVSAIRAMAESIKGFRTLDSSASKTFIYTGNGLNKLMIPPMFTFGMAKSSTAYAINMAATGGLYDGEGMKFYYLDERSTEDGAPMGDRPGAEAAAEMSLELSEDPKQRQWDHIYMRGKGLLKHLL
jgi:NAD(P)-dependent dehydrogenase (short-subunit alcohol dehydrogenase family)